jgi:lysophospholipase L1-like esterase
MVVRLVLMALGAALLLSVACGSAPRPERAAGFLGRKEGWDYAAAMRGVAERFTGTPGVVLHLGDSITVASPYTAWAREGTEGKTAEDTAVLQWSHCGERDERDGWYLASHDLPTGATLTAAGGIRADQYLAGGFKGLPSLDEIVRKYNPEVAIVMLGTNDSAQGRSAGQYAQDMERIVARLLDNGTIIIVSTIPPLFFDLAKAPAYNDALWRIAAEHRLPVIDYYGEIVTRRPGTTWNGTLLQHDDVHPTADRAGVTSTSAPTPDHLRESGYLLRGWLSVQKLEEVKRRAIDAKGAQ